ncbi:MAG: RNA pyrophosphohydrolase [Bauldia sp.]|nr:RNA pyrophosphohydrolase [Bauldia sp.]
MVDIASLPYRSCAGVTLFNRKGNVFVGKRKDGPNEAEGVGKWWQMPQGGIDGDEDLVAAARREMFEETNVRSAMHLGTMDDWMEYDLPAELVGKAWRGKYRGQRIRFVAFLFEGQESEIDVLNPGGGEKPEFVEWRWEPIERLPELIIPFKRKVYEAVVTAFSRFAVPTGAEA